MPDIVSVNGLIGQLRGSEGPPVFPNIFALGQGAQFGDSVFEGILLINGSLLFREEHLVRLRQNAQAVGIDLPEHDELNLWIDGAVTASEYASARVRLTVYRGHSGWGIDGNNAEPSHIAIVITQSVLRAHSHKPLSVAICRTVRKPHVAICDMRVKQGSNYSILRKALQEAASMHADDGLLLSADGFVSEAVVENVFWLTKGTLFTPEVSAKTNCLPGITRSKVLLLARQLGIPCSEGLFTVSDLYAATEMFLTGTSAGIVPVGTLDDRGLSEAAEVTRLIAHKYDDLCRMSTRQ